MFQAFCGVADIGNGVAYLFGVGQLIIVVCFVVGMDHRLTYCLVLAMHTASTVVSFPKYLAPYDGANLLFFASWPMLAACFALFYLRDLDTRGVV